MVVFIASILGFNSLFELDMSDCVTFNQSIIYHILSHQENIPNLTHLNLASTGPFTVDQSFIDVLCLRPLTNIDLSFNPIICHFNNATCICICKNFPLIQIDEILKSGICSSLKLVDGRTLRRPEYGSFVGKCLNSNITTILYDFFLAVQVFHAPTYFNSFDILISNCSLYLYPNTSITELHMTNNVLPNYDIKLHNPIIQLLDISYNNIESISPDAFLNLPLLVKVYLSHNDLHQLSSDPGTWLSLFKRRIPLEIIDLSYNQLTALPKDTFKYNANLRELNLQGNRLQQITFNASHIFSLEILDLRNNSFEFLDGYSRRYLERRQETNCSSLSFAF